MQRTTFALEGARSASGSISHGVGGGVGETGLANVR